MNLSTLALTTALAAATLPAQAAFNEPLVFGQAGSVTLTLEVSTGGYDHILELADVLGPVGSTPLMALTDSFDPSADVLGFTPAAIGDSVALGSFGAGQEIGLRLTNVESSRLGTPGTLGPQVFTGSASILNEQSAMYYSLVEWISPTQLRVQIEDLFPADPETNPTALDGFDVQVLLTLAPVPEPGSWALMLGGLAALGFMGRRRAG